MPRGRKRVVTEAPQVQLFGLGKICKHCGIEQNLEQFRVERSGNPRSKCRTCERAGLVAWVATQTPEQQRAAYASWKRRNPRKYADGNLRTAYGIGLEDVEAMLEAQGGTCAIKGCDRRLKSPVEASELADKARVDHCHATGEVRGLLCQKHNTGLGLLGDNAAGLRAALAYLETFEAGRSSQGESAENVRACVREAA
jgi:hypothetical protein